MHDTDKSARWPLDLALHPREQVALQWGDGRQLSYGALQDRVRSLARAMQNQNVTRGNVVAICLGRSFDWIASALAAMQLGAAYLPLDAAWPEQRLRDVLNDSGAQVVVADRRLAQRLGQSLPLLDPAGVAHAVEEPAADTTESALAAGDDLAYVIYTSGSSGVPKGVEITRANLAHLVRWHVDAFGVTAQDRASHLAGLGFDAAGWELWPYLAAGASIMLVDDETRCSPTLLQRWLLAHRITIAFVPTGLAGPITGLVWPEHSALRILLTGGDTLQRAPAHPLPFRLANNYGPTECTVVATSGLVESGDLQQPSIGTAIAGTTVYLLDEHGVQARAGEIVVGGAGVGRGYRNLPQLTAERFVHDPFSGVAGARMYRTGDLGERLADGQIAFRGRMDRQEKIRGQRVELEEIGTVLHRHPAVLFASVGTSLGVDGEKQLVAHVHLAAGHKVPSATELQHFVSDRLPAVMVPTLFVRLDEVPLTAIGKFDRDALAAPCAANLLARHSAREPDSPTEQMLLELVRRLVGVPAVTVEDDFFLIGGHSLLGTQLVLRVRQAFAIEFTLRDLFEAPTVERLARRVETLVIADLDRISEADVMRQQGA